MKWRIEFRYIPPYDMTTPLMHIPLEVTIREAPTAEIAWDEFVSLGATGNVKKDWYRKIQIERLKEE